MIYFRLLLRYVLSGGGLATAGVDMNVWDSEMDLKSVSTGQDRAENWMKK